MAPFSAETRWLPHFVPNAGVRLGPVEVARAGSEVLIGA